MPQHCRRQILPLVQSILDNSPLRRLGNHYSTTVFTEKTLDFPLLSVKQTQNELHSLKTIAEARSRQLVKTWELNSSIPKMHRGVAVKLSRTRKIAIESHNQKTGVQPVNFTEGDYVPRGLLQREKGRKPSLK